MTPGKRPSARSLRTSVRPRTSRGSTVRTISWAIAGVQRYQRFGRLVLAPEELGDRLVGENRADGVGDDLTHRHDGQLLEPLLRRDRQRVRDDDLRDRRV